MVHLEDLTSKQRLQVLASVGHYLTVVAREILICGPIDPIRLSFCNESCHKILGTVSSLMANTNGSDNTHDLILGLRKDAELIGMGDILDDAITAAMLKIVGRDAIA